MNKLSVVLASSECVPFAKTGGMADVIFALAKELSHLDMDVLVFLPFYKQIQKLKNIENLNFEASIRIGDEYKKAHYYQTIFPDSNIKFFLIKNDEYFDRDELYGESGKDYHDNLERFILFNKAILNYIVLKELKVDIIHCNDWQTALIPAFLKLIYQHDEILKNVRTLFTIHNFSYQGIFNINEFHKLNFNWEYFTSDKFEFYGKLNLLKAGIVYSDFINTVSPTYRNELLETEIISQGLTGILRNRSNEFVGILNGVDYTLWSPTNYNIHHLEGKLEKKRELLKLAHLKDEKKPLFVMISRLVALKGFDLLVMIMKEILAQDMNFIILGNGDPLIHDILLKYQKSNNNLKVFLEFNEKLAYLIEEGGDIFLMPSRFEPCGLNQLYSLKFGTVPLVHHTGGLADTIIDYQKDKAKGTGFVFYEYNAKNLLETIFNSIKLYQDRTEWVKIQKNGMSQDFSWKKSAKEYLNLYNRICQM